MNASFEWARRSVDAVRTRAPASWAVGVAIFLGGLVAVLMTVDMKSLVWIYSAAHLALGILFLANVRWLERALELPLRVMTVHPLLWFLGLLATMLGSIAVYGATHDAAPGVATGALVLVFAGIGFCVFWLWGLWWSMVLDDVRTRQVLRVAATVVATVAVTGSVTMLWSYLE